MVFVYQEAMRTTSVIQQLWELDLSVGAQMAYRAKPCLEGSLAVWTGDGGNVWIGLLALAFLACLRRSAAAVLLAWHIMEAL